MTPRRFAATGALCGVAVFACRPDSTLTPRTTEQPAATRTITASAVSAATLTSEASNRYLVVLRSGSGSSAIAAELGKNGGRLEGLRDDLGFAVVSGISAEAATRLRSAAGIAAVEADIEFALEPIVESEAVDATDVIESATAPQTASQFGRQWNMRAVAANNAWAAGFLGSSDVRVAILDTGIDYLWPDLVGRVDLTRSISLRPDEDARFATWFPGSTRHPITDLNAHGTLVSTVVASNSGFFAGVTTRTTLFGVKVCIVFNTCSTAATLNGIVYAVDHGADVINMSLGGAFLKSANPGFVSVINRVFNYANQRGTLIVVASGNNAADLDHFGNVYFTYCDSPHVVCVSATGPTAAPTSVGPFTNPDAVAPYTNFGRSAISLAAPGGGVTTVNAFVTGPCSSTSLNWFQPPRPTPTSPLPPPVIVGPLCPLPGLFLIRGAGTSFSSPHVAGAAAQIVAQIGHGRPSQVQSALQNSADDLGQSGTDPFYGKGRLNVARAVGAIP
jgi:lantibiotic leader peptide-processing serine protease